MNKTKIHLTTTYLFLSQKLITYTKLEQAQITVLPHIWEDNSACIFEWP